MQGFCIPLQRITTEMFRALPARREHVRSPAKQRLKQRDAARGGPNVGPTRRKPHRGDLPGEHSTLPVKRVQARLRLLQTQNLHRRQMVPNSPDTSLYARTRRALARRDANSGVQAAWWRWRPFASLRSCAACDTCDLISDAENAEHLTVRPCGRRRYQRGPAAAIQLLTNGLERGPCLAAGFGRPEADRRELQPAAEIRNALDIDPELPKVSGHLADRFGLQLGQRPIPLSPRSLRAIGEIERLNDRAALPTSIGRIRRAGQWITPSRALPPPDAVYDGGSW